VSARQPLTPEVDVLVVGAGQAGLATAYWLTREPGPRVLVLDRAEPGQSWRDRYDSLVLFTPRRYSALPGLRFPAGPGRPTRTEVAHYLQDYARRFDLPVRTGVEVHRLLPAAGGFTAETSEGAVAARQVVVAAGPFARPYVPALASSLDPEVTQLHSSTTARRRTCRPVRCWSWAAATPPPSSPWSCPGRTR
jgi:putative flavoprotein involved in K+ transport